MDYKDNVLERMQSHLKDWEENYDDRGLFLRCYLMMTQNMIQTVQEDGFQDSVWVDQLLNHFAGYYFNALKAWETEENTSPLVWRFAFSITENPEVSALQKMLLGINAHINYDLVFTLYDLLQPEWDTLNSQSQRFRYEDHCQVNEVISKSIDAVQDTVLEPSMPITKYIDVVLGPIDEYVVSKLITAWREQVWTHTMELLTAKSLEDRERIASKIEEEALKIAGYICPGHLR